MVFYDPSTKTIYESSIITNIPYATFIMNKGWFIYKDDDAKSKKCIHTYEELKDIYIKRGYHFKNLSEYPTPYLSNYTIIDEIEKNKFLLSNGQLVSDFYLSHSTVADRIYYDTSRHIFIRFNNKKNEYNNSPFINEKANKRKTPDWEITNSKNLYKLLPYSEDFLLKMQEPQHLKDLLIENYNQITKNKTIISPIIPKECSKLQIFGLKMGKLTDYRPLAKKLGLSHETLKYNGIRHSRVTYSILTENDRCLSISEDMLIKILTTKNVKKQFTFEKFNKYENCTVDLWEMVRLYKKIKTKLENNKFEFEKNNKIASFREFVYDRNLKQTKSIIAMSGDYETNRIRYLYYINKILNPIFESIGLEPLVNVNSKHLNLSTQQFSNLLLGFHAPIRGLVVYKGDKRNDIRKQIVNLYIDIETKKSLRLQNSFYIFDSHVKTMYQKWYKNECLRKQYLEPFMTDEYKIMSYDEFYNKIQEFITISTPPIKYKNNYYNTKTEIANFYQIPIHNIYKIARRKKITFFQALDKILENTSLERI